MLSDCVFNETRWRSLTFPRNFKFQPGRAETSHVGNRNELSARAEIRHVIGPLPLTLCLHKSWP